jgi:hypothetical protein
MNLLPNCLFHISKIVFLYSSVDMQLLYKQMEDHTVVSYVFAVPGLEPGASNIWGRLLELLSILEDHVISGRVSF